MKRIKYLVLGVYAATLSASCMTKTVIIEKEVPKSAPAPAPKPKPKPQPKPQPQPSNQAEDFEPIGKPQ